MMDPHARTLDDALADALRALEARPRNPGPSFGPSGRPGHSSGGDTTGNQAGTANRHTGGTNAAQARHHSPVASRGLPARFTLKVDPLTAVILVLVAVVSFQQVAARIDRHSQGQPTLTRLLFAPNLTGERGL